MPKEFKFSVRKDTARQTSPWWIDIPPRFSETKRRQKKFFKTQELAKGELQRLKTRVANHGISRGTLSASVEDQAASAVALLKEAGMKNRQLVSIVADYIKREKARAASVTLLHCFDEYIKKAEEHEKSDQHIQGLKAAKKLCTPLHDRMLPDISHTDILELLKGFTKSTHNLKLRQLRAVFNFAMAGGRGWILENPADQIEFEPTKLKEPEIYSPKQVAEFMDLCVKKDRDLLPALVLMFFCGVRPDHNSGEITKVEWDHIFLEDDPARVELPAGITKTGRRRTISLREAPLAWLRWWVSTGGNPVGRLVNSPGELFKKRLYAVLRTKKGQDEKPLPRIKDGTRKSFASYVARSESKDVAIRELGHTGSDLLDKHYRSDVAAADATAFWNILPPPIEGATITDINAARKSA
jgi:integrase